jgi:D-serine deaminase-like pyridoxal phosphate-dependent protein
VAGIARERGVTIAGRQLESGAAGITVVKVSEAEVIADGDIRDIFIAYPRW